MCPYLLTILQQKEWNRGWKRGWSGQVLFRSGQVKFVSTCPTSSVTAFCPWHFNAFTCLSRRACASWNTLVFYFRLCVLLTEKSGEQSENGGAWSRWHTFMASGHCVWGDQLLYLSPFLVVFIVTLLSIRVLLVVVEKLYMYHHNRAIPASTLAFWQGYIPMAQCNIFIPVPVFSKQFQIQSGTTFKFIMKMVNTGVLFYVIQGPTPNKKLLF